MNELRRRRLGAVLLATLIAVIVGIVAYRMGMAHGLALGAQVEAGQRAIHPYAWQGWHGGYGWYGWPGPWGFGFGFGPIFLIVAWIVVLRVLFWRGGPRWYHHRRGRRGFGPYDDRWDEDGPRSFDERHRRAHERMRVDPPPPSATMV